MNRKVMVAVLTCATLLAGCANQNSIFRINRVSGARPTIVTVDAKQRHFMAVPEVVVHSTGGSETVRQWRMCAEASPDVFSALSTSAAADLGFGQSGAQTEAQARAALAIAESAGTIERTQTINMLRESMYRTCERYMSGAIDRATFVVQAGRDWRAMIAILAIEQLTRTARPPSTLISPGTTSASIQSRTDIDAQVIAAQDAAKAAGDELAASREADPQNCDPLTDANREACTRKSRAIEAAQGRLTLATQHRDYWQRRSESPPPPNQTDASTGTGTTDAGGGDSAVSDTTVGRVSDVVGEIVRRAFDTDETQLFCLQVLTPQSGLVIEERLRTRCSDYLMAVVEAEGALLLERADLRHRGFAEAMAVRTAADQLLNYLRSLRSAQYEAEAAAIRQFIPSFCRRAENLEQCIRLVEEGSLDGIDANLIQQALQARSRQGGEW